MIPARGPSWSTALFHCGSLARRSTADLQPGNFNGNRIELASFVHTCQAGDTLRILWGLIELDTHGADGMARLAPGAVLFNMAQFYELEALE